MNEGIFNHFDHYKSSSSSQLYTEEELRWFTSNQCLCQHPLIPLHPLFLDELKQEQHSPQKYIPWWQRQDLEIRIDGLNRFVDKQNQLLDGTYIYTLLADHRLIAARVNLVSNHSHLSGGMPVLNAGYLFFWNGFLVNFNNNSGHYKPELSKIQHSIAWLYNLAQNQNLVFEDHSLMSSSNRKVRYFHVHKLLANNPKELNVSKLKEKIPNALNELLHKVSAIKDSASPPIEQEKTSATPKDCLNGYYTFVQEISEEERALIQERQRNYILSNYTMDMSQSRFAGSRPRSHRRETI